MLGYLIGLHYALPDHRPIGKRFTDPFLDWSWLVNPKSSSANVQSVLTCFFSSDHPESGPSWEDNLTGDVSRLSPRCRSNIDPHSTVNNDASIAPILEMLGVLNYLLEHHPTSVQDGPTPKILVPLYHSLHTAFILLPLLLLYHDNTAKQHDQIETWLRNWQYSEGIADVREVGLTLSQAMKIEDMEPSIFPGSRLTRLNPHAPTLAKTPRAKSKTLHEMGLTPIISSSCNAFLHSSSNYEMGLLGLLHLFDRAEENWAILPLMMGLNGSLLGCKFGFSGLPLIWRYAIAKHKQSLRPKTAPSQKQDVGVRLTALWNGGQKPLETWHSIASMPRSIP